MAYGNKGLDQPFPKTEVTPQLDQELLETCEQSLMKVGLGMTAGEAEKFGYVRIAKNLQRRRMSLSQCR
ncbi:hypothetical protein BI292_06775 [Pseudomonas sp. 43NM1]|nr:hypothetical protein BI292_06775 [Pseudomonas sp. 43NM1]